MRLCRVGATATVDEHVVFARARSNAVTAITGVRELEPCRARIQRWLDRVGPLSRVGEFKAIEIAAGTGANGPNGLQQLRYPETRTSDTPSDAKKRLFDVVADNLAVDDFTTEGEELLFGLDFGTSPTFRPALRGSCTW